MISLHKAFQGGDCLKKPQFYRTISPRLPEFRRQVTAAAKKCGLGIKEFFHRLTLFIVRLITIYLRKKVPRSAAEMSYHIIFSIFPLLICIHWFLGLLHLNYDETIQFLREFLPIDMVNIIVDYLEYIAKYQSNALLYAGLFMLITPFAAALRALKSVINSIYSRGRASQNILDYLLSFGYSLIFLLVIYACIFILFTGEKVLLFFINTLGTGEVILSWRWMRFLVLFIIISLLLYLFYRFLPYSINRKHRLFEGNVFPGVLFASLTLEGVSILFSWFIGLSTRYSLIYGSLASIIIFMLWVYICCNIMIIGSIVNLILDQKDRLNSLSVSSLSEIKESIRSLKK